MKREPRGPQTSERGTSDGRYTLTVETIGMDRIGDDIFAAKVTAVWNETTAQDDTARVRGQLHEHRGVDRPEAMEKAIAEAERVLRIATGK
jgi:hypothetical protein